MDLIDDISKLTTIYKQSLLKLVNVSEYCICHGVEETVLKNEDITSIDTSLGKLLIGVDDNELKFKFIPSKSLENSIKKTIIAKKSPLTAKVDESLKESIVKTYKDML